MYTKEGAEEARDKFHGYEIRPDFPLKVAFSVDKRYLKIFNIPANKTRDEILQEMSSYFCGIVGLCVRPDRRRTVKLQLSSSRHLLLPIKPTKNLKTVDLLFSTIFAPFIDGLQMWKLLIQRGLNGRVADALLPQVATTVAYLQATRTSWAVLSAECDVLVGEHQGAVAEKEKVPEALGCFFQTPGAAGKKRKQQGDCIVPDMNVKLQNVCEELIALFTSNKDGRISHDSWIPVQSRMTKVEMKIAHSWRCAYFTL
ncbi:hypothetical protein CEXT_361491 [Caerostris extrusa]|uniref:Uncharacterized protein n=1 Tax=Caerostris extrusa TaxID=172846 RepID=A0AAV4PSR4_CAEEX|nr:hypothetical protein CEXT_361491 [Caerostris extrusa]